MSALVHWLPLILSDRRYCASDLRIAGALARLSNESCCRVSLATLARDARTSPMVAKRAATRLENRGRLQWRDAEFCPTSRRDRSWSRVPITFALIQPPEASRSA